MATPPFKYQAPFPLGPDTTEYYLLTKDYVSVSEFEGQPMLKIAKEGLTAMANAAFRDVAFMLRPEHNEQVAKILSDPEASDNDKFVALTFLRNAEVKGSSSQIHIGEKASMYGLDIAMKKAFTKLIRKKSRVIRRMPFKRMTTKKYEM